MRYIKRQIETVEAVRYNGCVDEELINILKGKSGLFYFDYDKLYVYNETNKPQLVTEGEMIVCYRSGLLGVVEPEEFHLDYKELNNECLKVDLATPPELGRVLLN